MALVAWTGAGGWTSRSLARRGSLGRRSLEPARPGLPAAEGCGAGARRGTQAARPGRGRPQEAGGGAGGLESPERGRRAGQGGGGEAAPQDAGRGGA